MRKFIWGFLLVLLVLFLGAWFFLRSDLPNYSQELELPGLRSPVEVFYDQYAIPHIYAENEKDVFYAFGYVHAQERLFQMEVLRRLAEGRLSEVFGEAALPTDKFFRTLQFREHAKIALANRPNDGPEMEAAHAYVKGINYFLDNGPTPLEFRLAGIPKKPFTVEDMEMIVGYMGYTFESAFKTEPLATQVFHTLSQQHYEDLFAQWPDSAYKIPVNSAAGSTLLKIYQEVASIQKGLAYPPFFGSNQWALSGKRTESGKPILSNDTHIAFAQPSVWYEAHLVCPGLNLYGNFLAGVPLAALGHTTHGAWGLTMFQNDEADFYREKVNPENANQIWYKGAWVDLEVKKEVIKVKDQSDVVLEVKKSPHGYLLNGAFKEIDSVEEPISLWWVYHQLPSKHLEVFYGLSKAKNVYEAREAVKPLTAPGLNIMWTDTAGNIGWWAAGKLPKRPKHVDPMLILDGSTGTNEPMGWEPFDLNPQNINPPSGFLYSANNQPADMGNGLVPGYYVPANRARRIVELFADTTTKWNAEKMRIAINDVTSPSMKEMAQEWLSLVSSTPEIQQYLDILRSWDGSHTKKDIAPTLFYRWEYEIMRLAFEDELGKEAFLSLEHNLNAKRNMNAFMKNNSSPWWDNVKTPSKKESRKEIIQNALENAIRFLNEQLGTSTKDWEWGKVHLLTHKHPMGLVAGLDKLFNVGPLNAPGGRETVNNLDFTMDSTGVYNVLYGPALRRIIDMGHMDMGHSVNPTGQSGHVFSKHYDDQAPLFVDGGSRAELKDKKLIEANAMGKSVFNPSKK